MEAVVAVAAVVATAAVGVASEASSGWTATALS